MEKDKLSSSVIYKEIVIVACIVGVRVYYDDSIDDVSMRQRHHTPYIKGDDRSKPKA